MKTDLIRICPAGVVLGVVGICLSMNLATPHFLAIQRCCAGSDRYSPFLTPLSGPAPLPRCTLRFSRPVVRELPR